MDKASKAFDIIFRLIYIGFMVFAVYNSKFTEACFWALLIICFNIQEGNLKLYKIHDTLNSRNLQ